MKKLVLTEFNKVELIEEPIPVPGPGEAVIRIRYAGICGSDLHVFAGLHPAAKVPMVMGHEACGTLHSICSDRADIQVGDLVCCHTIKPCNTCDGCCSGRENLCASVKIMGTNMDGVFTQYICVDANRIMKFNEGVDPQIAALVEPLTVGIHNLRRADIKTGETVLISGAGPIGLIIGILARFSGAESVVFSEIDPTRIQIAKDMGFTVVNPTEESFNHDCAASSEGAGFDKVFEITSVQSSFSMCVSQLKRGGTMVQVGMPPAGKCFEIDINKLIYSECDLRGVRHHTMYDMQCAVKLINSGVLDHWLRKLVSVIYPLGRSLDAIAQAGGDKSVLRVLIDFFD